jgi:hypothetical protein
MDNKPTDNTAQSQPIQPAQTPAPIVHHKVTVVAFVLTILAWVTLPLHYVISAGLCIIGLALSIFAVRKNSGNSRNLALVSLVAAAVLLAVYAIIWGSLFYIMLSY